MNGMNGDGRYPKTQGEWDEGIRLLLLLAVLVLFPKRRVQERPGRDVNTLLALEVNALFSYLK